MTRQRTRVRIVQQGGFAGTLERANVDTSELGEAGAREVEEACRALAGLAGAAPAEPQVGADIPRYLVEIQQGNRTRRFEVPEMAGEGGASAGDGMNAILDRLANLPKG